jgi:hypothetical protein
MRCVERIAIASCSQPALAQTSASTVVNASPTGISAARARGGKDCNANVQATAAQVSPPDELTQSTSLQSNHTNRFGVRRPQGLSVEEGELQVLPVELRPGFLDAVA